jgi:hypothetical protein
LTRRGIVEGGAGGRGRGGGVRSVLRGKSRGAVRPRWSWFHTNHSASHSRRPARPMTLGPRPQPYPPPLIAPHGCSAPTAAPSRRTPSQSQAAPRPTHLVAVCSLFDLLKKIGSCKILRNTLLPKAHGKPSPNRRSSSTASGTYDGRRDGFRVQYRPKG